MSILVGIGEPFRVYRTSYLDESVTDENGNVIGSPGEPGESPKITAVSPASVPVDTDTVITITGEGLTGSTGAGFFVTAGASRADVAVSWAAPDSDTQATATIHPLATMTCAEAAILDAGGNWIGRSPIELVVEPAPVVSSIVSITPNTVYQSESEIWYSVTGTALAATDTAKLYQGGTILNTAVRNITDTGFELQPLTAIAFTGAFGVRATAGPATLAETPDLLTVNADPPSTFTSISPSSVPTTGSATSYTVVGTWLDRVGFYELLDASSAVAASGTVDSVSATQVQFSVAAALAAGTFDLVLRTASSGTVLLTANDVLTVTVPAPSITSLSPNTYAVTAWPVVSVNGTGLAATTKVILRKSGFADEVLTPLAPGATDTLVKFQTGHAATSTGAWDVILQNSSGGTVASAPGGLVITGVRNISVTPPAVLVSASARQYTVTGVGYAQVAKFTLRETGGGAVACNNLAVDSANETTVLFTVPASLAADKQYDLTLTLANASTLTTIYRAIVSTTDPIAITSISPNSVATASSKVAYTITGTGLVCAAGGQVQFIKPDGTSQNSVSPTSVTATQIVATPSGTLPAGVVYGIKINSAMGTQLYRIDGLLTVTT